MKRFLNTFLLFVFIASLMRVNSLGATVPERIRIGLKYGSSSVTYMNISSQNGFYIRAQGASNFPIAQIKSTSLKVDLPIKDGVNSYFVVQKDGFSYYDDVLNYCANVNQACVPLYRNNTFYAVRENLYSKAEMEQALSSAKAANVNAYYIEPSSLKTRVTDANGKTVLLFSQDDGEILGLASLTDGLLNIGTEQNYRDILEFLRKDTNISVISNVTMQHYLYSVVPAEIGASAPLEAQKAQAVCARTYAIANLSKHQKDGFNLCASTDCQMYIGTKWERERSTSAVDQTIGQIATYNGKPISAVYSAHSGGRTADVSEVWGTKYDYLKSVEDPYCTDYTWEVDLNFDTIATALLAKGYDFGKISDIKVLERSGSDRVSKLQIIGEKTTMVFEREKARIILGLKSQMYEIPSSGITQNIINVNGVSSFNILNYEILTAYGKATVGESVDVKNGQGSLQTYTASKGNKIFGKGNGHGVGFCQCGAMGFANAGWDYIKILKYYYQGIEIEGI